MFGYIQPLKPELKVRELEIFRAYYCGVCRSLAERRMQLPRFALSNDAVFLSLVLSFAYNLAADIKGFRCIIHPLKKRPVTTGNAAIDYAADVNVVLAWYKAADDVADGARIAGTTGKAALMHSFGRVKKRWGLNPSLAIKLKSVAQNLNLLKEKEKSGCGIIDEAAEPFARLTASVFNWKPDAEDGKKADEITRVLDWMGYNIGKWIYIADAWCDLGKDLKKGNYNAVAASFGWAGKNEKNEADISCFRNSVRDRVGFLMTSCLEQASSALSLLDSGRKERQYAGIMGIIENVIYLGLRRKMEDMLDGKSIRDTGN